MCLKDLSNQLVILGLAGTRKIKACKSWLTAKRMRRHHLLMNQEMYEEHGVAKRTGPVRTDQSFSQKELSAEDMVDILRRSGYQVRKIDRGACG